MRLFGELEKAGRFLVQSLVCCDGERFIAADDKASRQGEVTASRDGGEPTGSISGD